MKAAMLTAASKLRASLSDDRDGPASAQEEPKAVTVVGGIGGAQARRWQAEKKGQDEAKIAACPGVISMVRSRPWPSTTAWILVVRPPRERPIACSSAPLFRPPRSDEPLPWCCRSRERHRGLLLPRRETASARGHAPTIDESGCRLSSADRSPRDNPAGDSRS
jgi:hypothetical protein